MSLLFVVFSSRLRLISINKVQCTVDTARSTLFILYKNDVFRAQAEYSYFSADFRLKIFWYYS